MLQNCAVPQNLTRLITNSCLIYQLFHVPVLITINTPIVSLFINKYIICEHNRYKKIRCFYSHSRLLCNTFFKYTASFFVEMYSIFLHHIWKVFTTLHSNTNLFFNFNDLLSLRYMFVNTSRLYKNIIIIYRYKKIMYWLCTA